MTVALVAAMLAVAAVDWYSVYSQNRRLEYVVKPLTMVPLIVLAATMDVTVPSMRWWFVAALVFSLLGDVFLMLPDKDHWFIAGLGSFFVGHVGYVVGFAQDDQRPVAIAVAAVLIALVALPVARRIITAARTSAPDMVVPVLAYITVISVMVLLAVGSVNVWAIVGALSFYASDSFIGWSRFVGDFTQSRMAIIVTYHVGQLLLILSLAH